MVTLLKRHCERCCPAPSTLCHHGGKCPYLEWKQALNRFVCLLTNLVFWQTEEDNEEEEEEEDEEGVTSSTDS